MLVVFLPEAQVRPLSVAPHPPAEEHCNQWVAASLTFLMQHVWVSVVQRGLQPHGQLLGFLSVVPCS